jgi:hypothetical protein
MCVSTPAFLRGQDKYTGVKKVRDCLNFLSHLVGRHAMLRLG